MKYFILLIMLLNGCSKKSNTATPIDGVYPTQDIIMSSVNQSISNHPHKIDYFIPSNANKIIVFLHGGGGSKEGFAYNLGIKLNSTKNDYDLSSSGKKWLLDNKVGVIFPQGQMPNGTLLSATWSNYVMNSGVNDISFLQDLSDYIKNTYHVNKVFLAGHSNGGMMTNRMWCESPSSFSGYGSLAGPPSVALSSVGSHPCVPSDLKPYISLIGNSDSQLQTGGNMNASFWTCSNYNNASAAWVNGNVINEKNYYANRVTLVCANTVNTPIINGALTTYQDCNNQLELTIIAQENSIGGDHCLLDLVGGCTTTLKGNANIEYKDYLLTFFNKQP